MRALTAAPEYGLPRTTRVTSVARDKKKYTHDHTSECLRRYRRMRLMINIE